MESRPPGQPVPAKSGHSHEEPKTTTRRAIQLAADAGVSVTTSAEVEGVAGPTVALSGRVRPIDYSSASIGSRAFDLGCST